MARRSTDVPQAPRGAIARQCHLAAPERSHENESGPAAIAARPVRYVMFGRERLCLTIIQRGKEKPADNRPATLAPAESLDPNIQRRRDGCSASHSHFHPDVAPNDCAPRRAFAALRSRDPRRASQSLATIALAPALAPAVAPALTPVPAAHLFVHTSSCASCSSVLSHPLTSLPNPPPQSRGLKLPSPPPPGTA